jgi:hypothetical protein
MFNFLTDIVTIDIPGWFIVLMVFASYLAIREFRTRYDRSCGYCHHCQVNRSYAARMQEPKKKGRGR